MREALVSALMVIGALLMFLGGVGVLRMPDLFLRMSATTKVATLGIGCTLLAAALQFSELGIVSRALATIVFVLLTAPVSAHMLGRAAYVVGVPLWEGTIVDELRGRYDPHTHQLAGPAGPDPAGSAPGGRPGGPPAELG